MVGKRGTCWWRKISCSVLVGEFLLYCMEPSLFVRLNSHRTQAVSNNLHRMFRSSTHRSACTLIASKLLEITPPTVKDFRYISDNSYTAKEILKCEAKICSVLKFNFNFTTPYEYVDRYLRASFASPLGRATNTALKQMMERMVFYFLDLSLLDYKFVLVKPCLVAAAAVYLARATLGIREGAWNTSPPSLFGESFERSSQGFWTKTLEYYTGYDKWDLEEHVKSLRRLHEKAENSHLKSVYSKFKSEEFGGVALKTVLNEEGLGFF